ncbi:MAG: hypothetical protein D3923_16620 [Candidatus Electrothrix sp. AR3]|nr:hypothetical protein [Candidatus Electrothrix sp. AR3]
MLFSETEKEGKMGQIYCAAVQGRVIKRVGSPAPEGWPSPVDQLAAIWPASRPRLIVLAKSFVQL